MNYKHHHTRSVSDILRQHRSDKNEDMILDTANDAWLKNDGSVHDRYASSGIIGTVSNLHGAAMVSAALLIVKKYRSA